MTLLFHCMHAPITTLRPTFAAGRLLVLYPPCLLLGLQCSCAPAHMHRLEGPFVKPFQPKSAKAIPAAHQLLDQWAVPASWIM